MYSPTHYYVRVSRAETFTGVSLTSYRQTRAPPCAALDHHWGVRKPGRNQGAKGTPAAPSARMGPLPGKDHQHLPDGGPTSGERPAPRDVGRDLAPGPSPAAPSALLLVGGRPLSWGRFGGRTKRHRLRSRHASSNSALNSDPPSTWMPSMRKGTSAISLSRRAAAQRAVDWRLKAKNLHRGSPETGVSKHQLQRSRSASRAEQTRLTSI